VFDAGLGAVGVKTNVKVATFTAGTVNRISVDPSTGKDLGINGSTALQLTYKQIDAGYDISFLVPEFAGRYYIEEFTLGFRYMDYQLPRILYQLKDTSGSQTNYSFEKQSPAQQQRSQYYTGGLIWRFGPGGTTQGFSAFADLGFFIGSGPADYFLCSDNNTPEPPSPKGQPANPKAKCTQEEYTANPLMFDLSLGAGLRFRFTPRTSRFRVLAEVQYHAELVAQTIIGSSDTGDGAGRVVEYGGYDLFHGPRLSLVGSL
jgi:hypothetical protein